MHDNQLLKISSYVSTRSSLVLLVLSTFGLNAQVNELYRVVEVPSSKLADVKKMLGAEVVKHVDGDTVRVKIDNPPEGVAKIETVRLIGVDTPETVHPKKPVERFGIEASNYTKKALLHKKIYLAFDWDLRDKYNRLLVYIYTAPGECFNASLIANGYGHPYLKFPFQFLDEFRQLAEQARIQKKGLWR